MQILKIQLLGKDQSEMSGIKGLIDTNILIYLSNELLDSSVLWERYDELLISRITHIEALGYNFKEKKDEELVKELVSRFQLLELDDQVGEATINIRKKKKIKLPDAIIYATAFVNKCEIVTANVKDFKGIGEYVRIFNPIAK